jgi:hypothetical protein
MNAIEHLIYGGRIARTPVTEPPIFILGHWRSGTTMLHNLMTLNPRFTFLNLYECLFPGHFLLTQKINAPLTEWLLPKKRPMDNVEVAWSAPQEDEVALAVWTTLSPYLMPAFQGRMNVYERFLDPAEMTEPERRIWKDALLTLVKKVAMRRRGICVMKSPTHTYRVPTLLEMFPDARFVYIYRDPRAVYQSTIHLRKMMFAENTLGNLRPEVWSEETLYLYEKSVRRFEDTKHLIPEGNLFELRFEDLAGPARLGRSRSPYSQSRLRLLHLPQKLVPHRCRHHPDAGNPPPLGLRSVRLRPHTGRLCRRLNQPIPPARRKPQPPGSTSAVIPVRTTPVGFRQRLASEIGAFRGENASSHRALHFTLSQKAHRLPT